jgi:hypothetical protein
LVSRSFTGKGGFAYFLRIAALLLRCRLMRETLAQQV